jgi:trigger factor
MQEGNVALQVTITSVSDVQQEAQIELTPEELQPHFDRAYERFRPKAEVRGFRKGKVPLAMIKRLYGEAIEHEALDDIAGETFRGAMEERNIRPLGRPTMTAMDFKRGEKFHFTIAFDVRPPIALGKYKGITLERLVHTVTEEEVQGELDQILRANSTTSPADAVTDTDFSVTADVQELDEGGMPLIGKKTPGMKFILSDKNVVEEIRDALAQATVGGTYAAQFEHQHGEKRDRHRLSLTVTAIEKIALPAFDDAFVSKLTGGKVTSAAEFEKGLRTDLQRYYAEQADARVADDLANEVIRTHEFPVPESLVESYLDSFIEDLKNRTRDRKLPAGFDEKKYRESNRAMAVWQAKWALLKEQIAEKEQIAVTDEDLAARATDDSTRMGVEQERLLQYYRSSSSMTDRILADKITAFLKSHATITDRPAPVPQQA